MTSILIISEVIQKILSQEETKANLKVMVKEIQKSIDQLQEQKQRERNMMEDIKYSGSGPSGLRKQVDQLEAELAAAQSIQNKERESYESGAKSLLTVKSAVQQIIDKVERFKVDSTTLPILTDETLSDVIHVCEFRLLKALDLVSSDADADRRNALGTESCFSTMDLKTTLSDNNLRISTQDESAFKDLEDEEMDDDGDEVMDRDTLKNSSKETLDIMSSPERAKGKLEESRTT